MGDLKLGAFATPGAWEADPLVLVEGPSDALTLYAVAVPAVALVETRSPAWLARRTFGRRVALATDADAERVSSPTSSRSSPGSPPSPDELSAAVTELRRELAAVRACLDSERQARWRLPWWQRPFAA